MKAWKRSISTATVLAAVVLSLSGCGGMAPAGLPDSTAGPAIQGKSRINDGTSNTRRSAPSAVHNDAK